MPFGLSTMQQEEIKANLQALKRSLAINLASEESTSGNLLLIGSDLLLLLEKVKDTSFNHLIKRKAIAYIQECHAELDGYHAHQEVITPYATVVLKVAGRSLEQAINLMLYSCINKERKDESFNLQ